MFGSNFPVDSLYSNYRAILEMYEALLPGEVQQAVFGGVAAEFYRFGETHRDV